jgi:hypothetical protein
MFYSAWPGMRNAPTYYGNLLSGNVTELKLQILTNNSHIWTLIETTRHNPSQM